VDIKGKSKRELLELYDAIQEQKRRAKLAKVVYRPNAGQLPIHASSKTIRIVTSGNGAGKTTLAINEAIWRCQGYHAIKQTFTKVPTDVIVVLDQASKSDSIWVPEMRKWVALKDDAFKKMGRPNVSQVHFPNGSRIIFLSQEAEQMTYEGLSGYSMVIMDEPCPHFIWKALFRGARDKTIQPEFLVIGTPIGSHATWIRLMCEDISKGIIDYGEVFRTNSEVNKANLPEGFLEKFSEQLSESERLVRLEGYFSDLEGLALAHLWKRDRHVIGAGDVEWERSAPCVVAIDPHPSKKHVALLVGATRDGQIRVLKEMAAKLVPREFARTLRKWYSEHRVVDIVCDSLGSADMTGGEGFKSFIQILNEEGIQARPTTFEEKEDEAFIARIQDALVIPKEPNNFGLCVPKLVVSSECTGLIRDIEQVCWARDKRLQENKPKLEISNTDYLACLKYALATNLAYNKGASSPFYLNRPAYGFNMPSNRRALKKARNFR